MPVKRLGGRGGGELRSARRRLAGLELGLTLGAERQQLGHDLVRRQRSIDRLPEQLFDRFAHFDGRVDHAIAAAAIRADREQVFVFGVGREQPANDLGGGLVLGAA